MPLRVTYGDYRALGGALDEQSFGASLLYAQAEVDSLIGMNEVTNESAYKRAVCLAVNACDEASDATSVSIGSFSTSIAQPLSKRDAVRQAAMAVLGPTGMTYAGLR